MVWSGTDMDGYLALGNSLASASGPMQWDSAVSQCLSQCIKKGALHPKTQRPC